MGGGRWDSDSYHTARATRRSRGISDFAHSEQHHDTIHDTLDPARIRTKPFQKLESRDSADHPNSNAVFVMFDVTGSNINRAVEAQQRLPNLMDLLKGTDSHRGYLVDPQILIAANDDFHAVGKKAFQVSDFESDNRIDDAIRNTILVGNGGGNGGESYDLGMYCAARKTILDCFEKRQKKGYFFMYADEMMFPQLSARHIGEIFGDDVEANIPIAELVNELKTMYDAYTIWPAGSSYPEAYTQQVQLFGQSHALSLESPHLICELIASIIGQREGAVRSANQLSDDLAGVGVDSNDITSVSRSITFD